MMKFVIVLFVLLACGRLSAQHVEVHKSTDIVVIKGKSYYLHVVEDGQTLYSICKAYGVDINAVKELNGKQDNAISMFEVLKIPYVEPYVEKDGKYYYHKVEKGETLYSISRKFGIKVRQILKENKQYENTPLSIGAIVRLPIKEIDVAQIGTSVDMPVKETEEKVIGLEQTIPLEEKKHEPEEVRKNYYPLVGDTLAGRPEFMDDMAIPDNKYVKVALLLPLFVQENIESNLGAVLVDTLTLRKHPVQILHKSEQFLYFYEGMLLALDSLKNEGYKIDLHIFDSQKSSERMYGIAAEINELNPDLVIGPVYGSEFKVLTESLMNRQIPIVYPLSSRSEDFGKYPNFIQVNPSFQALAEDMAAWIAARHETANIICINLSKGGETEEQMLTDITEKNLFTEQLNRLTDIGFYKWNFGEEHLEALKLLLNPDQENIVVLPTSKEADVSKILPTLAALAEQYRITVIGFPDWQNFTSVDHEMYYKLNVKLFTYSYVDNYSDNAKYFADQYRTYFYTEPHTLSAKAYDMGLYFIPLVAKYGTRTLEAIGYTGKTGLFSAFNFRRLCPECGWENRGLYIVNYGSDYRIKMELVK